MGMGLLGYGKLDLCVSATKITIERVWEFGVLVFSIPRFWINKTTPQHFSLLAATASQSRQKPQKPYLVCWFTGN